MGGGCNHNDKTQINCNQCFNVKNYNNVASHLKALITTFKKCYENIWFDFIWNEFDKDQIF